MSDNYRVRNLESLDEQEVSFDTDFADEDGTTQRLTIHPWSRNRDEFRMADDNSVYLSIGWYHENGNQMVDENGEGQYFANTIVDRDQFISGLLEVCPELKRA